MNTQENTQIYKHTISIVKIQNEQHEYLYKRGSQAEKNLHKMLENFSIDGVEYEVVHKDIFEEK